MIVWSKSFEVANIHVGSRDKFDLHSMLAICLRAEHKEDAFSRLNVAGNCRILVGFMLDCLFETY